MRDYASDQAKAKAMIAKYSVPGHIKIVRGAGVLDPVNGTIAGGGQELPLNAVDLQVSRNLLGPNSDVVATDRMVLMDGQVKPLPSDSISIGGRKHKVINIMPLTPGGVDIIYKVVCRG